MNARPEQPTAPRLQIHTRERRFLIKDPAWVEDLLRSRGTPIEYVSGEPESRITTVYLDTARGTWSRKQGTTKFRCKNYDAPSTWWFELKRREGTVVDKWRRPVVPAGLEAILEGTQRAEALTRFVAAEALLPLAVVLYRRTAFEWNGLRATIDRDVRFYEAHGMAAGRLLGTLPETVVEVKIDGRLPAWLAAPLGASRARSFSKSRFALSLLRAGVPVPV